MDTEKDITVDLEKAKAVGKSAEFIITFGLLFFFLFIFPISKLVAFMAALAGYAVVNGIVYINYLRLKAKWKKIKDNLIPQQNEK
tara:strand:+ start:14929 stop:15183 length:255 start_codon:yes stop_codon:yes gene_type:complete